VSILWLLFVCLWLTCSYLHRTAFTTLAQSVPQLLAPSANSLTVAPSNQLASLTNAAPLLRADYPNVNFWTRHSWTAANKKTNDSTTIKQKAAERGGTRMANDENVSMRFIEDSEGVVIGGRRAQDIRRHMRSVFNHLADQPGGPASTWTGYAGVKQQYYYHEMANLFPELRLCELSWKADKLAIDAYPSWYQTYLKKDRERVKVEEIKAEGSNEIAAASVPEKHSRSPLLPSLQKRTKLSPPARIASTSTPSASTTASSTTSSTAVPSTPAWMETSPSTTSQDQLTRDDETSESEVANIGGKGKAKARDLETDAVEPQLPKVRFSELNFTHPYHWAHCSLALS
jgi:hypothetical protein